MITQRCLCLFLKSPAARNVKTRLASDVGTEAAAELYDAMVTDLLKNISEGPFTTCYYVDRPGALPNAAAEVPKAAIFHQQGRTLGKKMTNAFREQFSRGMEKVLLIGSDIPALDKKILDDYFRHLDNHDIVIGPAADGGYYLIGMKRDTFCPPLFTDMTWSTAAVFEETVKRIQDQGISFHSGPLLRDIDTNDDLLQVLDDKKLEDKIPSLRKRAAHLFNPDHSKSSHSH